MTYPIETGTVLAIVYHDAAMDDYTVRSSKVAGVRVVSVDDWNPSLGTPPTEQQINNWADDTTPLPSGQLFSEWQAEHGGDALLTLKRKAKERIDASDDWTVRALLALLDNLRKRGNTQATTVNSVGAAYSNLVAYLDTINGVNIPENAKLTGIGALPTYTQSEAVGLVKDDIDAGT